MTDIYSPSDETIEQAKITAYPTPHKTDGPELSKEEKIETIAGHFKAIMETLGLDINDSSLARTPYRVAKMYVNEIFSGLDATTFPKISFIKDEFQHDAHSNIVFLKVNFNSFCEHHFVPMNGVAYIAYLPNGKLIGLSKIPRLVRFFSKRPQVQERLTAQIADSLVTLLGTENVAVSLSAQHFCVIARGVENENSRAITNVLRGGFDSDVDLRREFFEAINRKFMGESF
ncbi:MAG: GTP cyclohydrolase I FolE [Parachlamydiaceae bacterium]|nr:GTP cyclohydrolase I FolE [Parachlamydiaceae bacterium]